MELSIRLIDRTQLAGFRPYLMPLTAAAIERGDESVTAVGAVSGRNSVGAAAVQTLAAGGARLTDLFVDAAVRRQGVGSFLLDAVIETLRSKGCAGVTAGYALDPEEQAAMDALLAKYGFTAPVAAVRCFKVMSEDYREHSIIKRAFSPRYRTPEDVAPFSELPRAALDELEAAADIPDSLTWSHLKARALPDLSVALVREEKILAYLLAEEGVDGGFILLAAVSREEAPPTAFITLLLELVNRCFYWAGAEFPLYFATINDHAERLARSLMNGRCEEYEEHNCRYSLDELDEADEEEEE